MCSKCGAAFRPPPPAAAKQAGIAPGLPSSQEPGLGVVSQLAWSLLPTATTVFLFFFGMFGLKELHGDGLANLLFWVGFLGAPATALGAPLFAAIRWWRVDHAWRRSVPRATLCATALLINIGVIVVAVFLFASAIPRW
jgi:hypothetical protein